MKEIGSRIDESVRQLPCAEQGAERKRGDGAEGGTRTRMDFSTRPSNVRVYQFHHFGR